MTSMFARALKQTADAPQQSFSVNPDAIQTQIAVASAETVAETPSQEVDGSVHVETPDITPPTPVQEPLGNEEVIDNADVVIAPVAEASETPAQEAEPLPTPDTNQVVEDSVSTTTPTVTTAPEGETAEGAEPVVTDTDVTPAGGVDGQGERVGTTGEDLDGTGQTLTPDATPTAEATEAPAQDRTDLIDNKVADVVRKRIPAHKAHTQSMHMDHFAKHNRRVQGLHHALGQQLMVSQLADVARENKMSAPLATAFMAVPGFQAAVESFPDSALYNVIPEPATSARQALALESFSVAESTGSQVLQDRAGDVVSAFGQTLSVIPSIVASLRQQVQGEILSLEASDITDEVLSDLSCHALQANDFTQKFAVLNEQLGYVSAFDVDELRAHPENIVQEIHALQALTTDVGPVIGLHLSVEGLVPTDRATQYDPTTSTFAQKDIIKTGLVLYLHQADQILDNLSQIAEKKDDLLLPLQSAAGADMPQALYSDEVTYGRHEHATLIGCYTTLVAKLVEESIGTVSMLLSTVDSVLDVDDGGTQI